MAKLFREITSSGIDQTTEFATSASASQAGNAPALDATGKLDESFLPDIGGPETFTLPAYEALSAGDLVNVFTDTGVSRKVRRADASDVSKGAVAFVKEAVDALADAVCYRSGTIPQTADPSVGGPNTFYLSGTTPGKLSPTFDPTWKLWQQVGFGTATGQVEARITPEVRWKP